MNIEELDFAESLITPNQAAADGYRPLTLGYSLRSEREMEMLGNVQEDMARGGIDHAIVDIGDDQVEVWRKPARTLVVKGNPLLN